MLDQILSPVFIARLQAEFPDFEQGNCIGDNGLPGGKSTTESVRGLGPAFEQLDAAIKSREFLQWLSTVTGISDLLYDPWYLGGGTHESHNGVSLDPHVDFNYHPSERWHRRLNLLIYLNPTWESHWGGCFELFRDPHASARPDLSITPTFNRGVLFETSERSWHGFNMIQLPPDKSRLTRRSLALYFYSRHRPRSEVADRHTTLYVKRQLPDRIMDGHRLDCADVAEIRDLLLQRDMHITSLYAENTALRKAQDGGLVGNVLYLARRAFVRFRR
ncbi:2OG-Fe(II) oxygenase [Stenotrophomonas sp. NPDC077464]|uniref:2OG-Fe(II) oxygenase n=1 Tax=unclassified Stenotrophomonas TaxID=196198 RepID=UPI0037D239B4